MKKQTPRGGGPPRWMEEVGVQDLVTTRNDVKWSLPVRSNASDVVFYLSTDDANDGNNDDYVVWKNLRPSSYVEVNFRLSLTLPSVGK